jgi:AraC family transcriptional regulator
LFERAPARLEHRGLFGELVTIVARPRTIMITPVGPVPDLRFHTSAELLHCALEEEFLQSVVNELDHSAVKPSFRAGIQDHPIQRILGLLLEELEAERPLGRLYVDSLAHALATRYILLDRSARERPGSRVTGLMPRLLSRVREKIEANLDADLSLESLAEESGYSRAHFLRMFRTATGLTPHQYVLDLRLRRAQERLRQPGSSIIDVVVSCGFASQSHMTSLFRQHLGTTPAQFRRDPTEIPV